MAAIALELLMEDRAVDMLKIEFSVNKILQERFFDNPSEAIVDHRSKLPFIYLRFDKSGHFNSG